MLKIGITGGIGAGKSTVSNVFETLGVPVFYADSAAKLVMYTDDVLKQELIEAFGEQTYLHDGHLNRPYLAHIVFNDAQELEKLNALVHPAVFRAFDAWVAEQCEGAAYVIKEAALLFESFSYKTCDYSILVTSPAELRIQRVMQRDHITQEQVLQRMDKQLSDEAKAELADFMLVNDEKQLLIPQILHLHGKFLALAAK